MWSTPSSTARRRTASAASRSRGGPKTPGPGELHGAEADAVDGLVRRGRSWSWSCRTPCATVGAATRRAIDPGTRTTTLRRRAELADFLRTRRAQVTPEQRRPGGQRPAPHAGPAPRGGRPARRGRAVLVHVARAGPRHHAVGAGARRARAGPRPRRRRARPPLPPRPRRAAAARRRLPARGAGRARGDRRAARAPPRLPARPAHRRAGLERRRDRGVRRAVGARRTGGANLLWWLFTDAGRDRQRRGTTARNTLARFRAEHARRFDDPAFAALIEELHEASAAVPRPVAAPRGARRAARDEDHRAPGARARCACTTCSRRRRATPTCA